MPDAQTLIEAYRNADDEKRIYLFLQYRTLRSDFVQIEHETYQSRLHQASTSDKKGAFCSVWRSLRAGLAYDKS